MKILTKTVYGGLHWKIIRCFLLWNNDFFKIMFSICRESIRQGLRIIPINSRSKRLVKHAIILFTFLSTLLQNINN